MGDAVVLPRDPVAAMPRRTKGRLDLVFKPDAEGRSFLGRQFASYPFHVCRVQYLDAEQPHMASLYLQSSAGGLFAGHYQKGQVVRFAVAHHDGNYYIDNDGLAALEDNDQVAFRYCMASGEAGDNPNGSRDDIAGIYNEAKTVLGLMPHPERLADPRLGGDDGKAMFESLVEALG